MRLLSLFILLTIPALHAIISVENTIIQSTTGRMQHFFLITKNTGNEQLYDVRVNVLNGADFYFNRSPSLAPSFWLNTSGLLRVPDKPGSYLIIANVTVRNYLNKDFNIISAGEYYVKRPSLLPVEIIQQNISLLNINSTRTLIRNIGSSELNLTVSVLTTSELKVEKEQHIFLKPQEARMLDFTISKNVANFNSNFQAYVIAQGNYRGAHGLSIVPFRIIVNPMEFRDVDKKVFLATTGIFALLIFFVVVLRWHTVNISKEIVAKPLSYSMVKFLLIAGALTALLLFYESNVFFKFNTNTITALRIIWAAYLMYAIPYSFKYPSSFFGEKDKIDIILEFAHGALTKRSLTFTPEVRTAFLALVVKAFFLPIMLDFTIINFWSIYASWAKFSTAYSLYDLFFTWGFEAAMAVLFFLDTWIFLISYGIEASFLGNKIRSVDPTLLGWAATLVCYPPFSGIVHHYIPSGPGDWADFNSMLITAFVRSTVIILFIIYVWATFALGMRSSNLTNRGIVDSGPYRYVRHPAYASKNLAWLLCALLTFNLPAILFQTIWACIYIVRAYTEEWHLSTDPEYQEYKKRIRWMFIPGIW